MKLLRSAHKLRPGLAGDRPLPGDALCGLWQRLGVHPHSVSGAEGVAVIAHAELVADLTRPFISLARIS